MLSETRELLIRKHDELVNEYNDDEDPNTLDLIAVLEIALLAEER